MKVLIFAKEKDLAPVGGPLGYLYNLKKGLDSIGENRVEFIKEKSINCEDGYIKKIVKKSKFLYKLFLPLAKKNSRKKWFENKCNVFDKMINKTYYENIYDIVDIDKYDIIHFHTTLEVSRFWKSFSKYKGIVVVTSHTPKPSYQEYLDGFYDANFKAKNIKLYENKLDIIDETAFSKSDYIIFPCKEAEEPYYNQWDKYESIHKKNAKKYRYVISGLDAVKAKVSRKEIRNKYNIPSDAFLISYIGRHNQVKGYDILKEIGKEVLKNENVYIICAGNEGPIYHLDNEKWIEVGWTNDPYSIVNASDLFILPNRETYFDLVFLEVLSLGKPMLVSNTGGNKYYKKYKAEGIFYYNNVKDALKKIDYIMNLNNLDKIGKKNKELFDNNFTSKIFANNYISLYESIYKRSIDEKNKK